MSVVTNLICRLYYFIKMLYMFRFFIYRIIMTLSSSLRHWNSTINIGPGFLSQVLEKLQQEPDENKNCALIFDAMAIRQQLVWNKANHKCVIAIMEIILILREMRQKQKRH